MERLSPVFFEHLTLRQLQTCARVNRGLQAWIRRYHPWTRFVCFVRAEHTGHTANGESQSTANLFEDEAKIEEMEVLAAHLVTYLSQPKALLDVLFASLTLLTRWPCPLRSRCAALMRGRYQHIHTLVEQKSIQAREMYEEEASNLDNEELPTMGRTQCVQCYRDLHHITYTHKQVYKPRRSPLDHLCLQLHLVEAIVDGLSWETLAACHRVAPFMIRGHLSDTIQHPTVNGLSGFDLVVSHQHLRLDRGGPHPLPDIYQHPCPTRSNALCAKFLHLAGLDMRLHGGTGSLFHALTWDPTFPCQSPPEEVFEYLCRARSPTQDILAFVQIWRRNFGLRAQSPVYCLDCRAWFCQHGSRSHSEPSMGSNGSNGSLNGCNGLLTRHVEFSGLGAVGDHVETYGCLALRLAFDVISLAEFFAKDTDSALWRAMKNQSDNARERYELLVYGHLRRDAKAQGTTKVPMVVAPRVWFYDAALNAWRPMGTKGRSLSSRGVRLQKTCGVLNAGNERQAMPPPFPWHVRNWWEQRGFTLRLFHDRKSAFKYVCEHKM